jgi:hypothetical protein
MPTYEEVMQRPDPVLSNIVISHELPNVVGTEIAPVVVTLERSFKYPEFDNSMRRPAPDTRRADSARANETDFNFRFRNADVEEHALDFPFSDKKKQEYDKLGPRVGAAALFNLERDGVMHAEGQLQMSREARIADTVRDASVPGEAIAGTSKWGDPAADIPQQARTARKAIWDAERKVMNTALLPWNAYDAAMWSPSMREFLGQNTAQFVTEEMMKRIFQVDNIVIGAEYMDVGMNPDTFAAPVYEDVWGTDAIFCHVAPENLRTLRGRPDSFAYTIRYGLTNNESAMVAAVQGNDASIPVSGWYEPGRESHFRRTKYEEKTQLINRNLGYILKDVI